MFGLVSMVVATKAPSAAEMQTHVMYIATRRACEWLSGEMSPLLVRIDTASTSRPSIDKWKAVARQSQKVAPA